MIEDPKTTGAEEPEVIRKPVVLPVETETDDGSRSVTKDRDSKDIVAEDTSDEPVIERKPVVIEPEPEE